VITVLFSQWKGGVVLMSMPGISHEQTMDRLVRHVRWGDTVRVDYAAWLEDGTMIDSSMYGEPLIFTTAERTVMQGMEELVIGMTVGETRTEKISADRAFGPYRPELSCQVSSNWLRAQHVSPMIGLGLVVYKTDGTLMGMVITGLEGNQVTLDANHRLAGKTLMVQLDLLEILNQSGSGVRSAPTTAA
jgi:peptidylprolyl isomerase